MSTEPRPKIEPDDEPGIEGAKAVMEEYLLDEDEPIVDQEASEEEDEVDLEEVPPEVEPEGDLPQDGAS